MTRWIKYNMQVLIIEQVVVDYKERSSSSHHRVINISAESVESQVSTDSANNAEQDVSRTSNEPEPHSLLRSFILLIALSFHSLFEGLAIGLQSDINGVLQIFTAVVLHKAIIAFSLGLNFVQTKLSLSSIIKSNMWFSITSPIGITIGILVENFANSVNSSLINGILQGYQRQK
ncbi:Zinc transporter ZIP1 [Blattella germanica]|nr:Zinc transporter ZIP1 [Blattella germanica]